MKIGFVILIAENKRLNLVPRYGFIKDMALRAERAGFDSIWLYDHLLYRPEGGNGTIGIWECWTMLSALAEATQQVELGTLVTCTAFRNPAILAKMAVTLDEISGGRLILGLGAGWNQPEFEAFGLPFDHRADRFEEAIQIIRPLVKEGKTDFEGKYYQAHDCEIHPFGPRLGSLPIMVGTSGPRMLRLTARYADMWNSAYFGAPETFVPILSEFKAACAAEGRDLSTIQTTALLFYIPPEAVPIPDFSEPYLTGAPDEIAKAICAYEDMGASHLIFHVVPYNEDSLESLAKGVEIFREAGKH